MEKRIQKVAILGAGVMGAQIAAHIANVGIPVLLYDLPAGEDQDDDLASQALKKLRHIRPAPFVVPDVEKIITPLNYDEHLDLLADCDLIIEAIAERMDLKKSLYERIAPAISEHAIIATNTSGLGLNQLAEFWPKEIQSRFLGIHFFNPPRYMALVELISTQKTSSEMLSFLEDFLVSTLGKSVVYAKDTPNFIGNRIGIFSLLITMYHAEQFEIPFEVADALTGTLIGRPRSASFRTVDIIGLDTMAHIIHTMQEKLQHDPWHQYFSVPDYLQTRINNGDLGQKTDKGFYAEKGKQVFSLKDNDYVLAEHKPDSGVIDSLKIKDPGERFSSLRVNDHVEAQFLWACYRDLFHYAAYHLEAIADSARDIDFAMRWGYGWKEGPFETWQAAGLKQLSQAISDDIQQDKSLADEPLPSWLNQLDVFHTQQGSYSPKQHTHIPLSDHLVYKRQKLRENVFGSVNTQEIGQTIYESDSVRLWHEDDDIGVVSLKTKMHVIDESVLECLLEAVGIAEKEFNALVLWSPQAPFSAGANLNQFLNFAKDGQYDRVDSMLKLFQAVSMALKHSSIPTVAAVNGLALGGGCEFQMHCDRAVVALESRIGLVESAVGLLPAGGGCKELSLRAAQQTSKDGFLQKLKDVFKHMVLGTMSNNAREAVNFHWLREDDVILANERELLYVAKEQALAMNASTYQPPLQTDQVNVIGKAGIEPLMATLDSIFAGEDPLTHDREVARQIAGCLTGGNVDAQSLVNQEQLLTLERNNFIQLLRQQHSIDRIEHMLNTGKRLRN